MGVKKHDTCKKNCAGCPEFYTCWEVENVWGPSRDCPECGGVGAREGVFCQACDGSGWVDAK